jgi:hypothetical protein
MPEYLAQTEYVNPSNPSDGIFQYAKGTKEDIFSYHKQNPNEGKVFNNVIGGVMARQASWFDIYPYSNLLEPERDGNSDNDSVLLVDMGGNIGHDLERFRLAHPDQASRLVLQDRPEVIAASLCPDPVQKMSHDFFKPQPIKGMLFYRALVQFQGERLIALLTTQIVVFVRRSRLLYAFCAA